MGIFAAPTVTATTVTNAATKIFDSTSSKFATGAYLTDLIIINTGTTTCFVGIAAVTTTGLRLAPGQQITFTGYKYLKGDTTGDVYAITASGTTTVETGLATDSTTD